MMEIVGGGTVLERTAEEEGLHPIPDIEMWQESVVLAWWDLENQVGGFHRIGHEPKWPDGPIISLMNNIFTPEYIYKDTATLPLRAADQLANGLAAGDTCRFEYDGHAIWTVSTPDISAELHAVDWHTPVDIYPKNDDLGRDFCPQHMEVGSKVTGSLTVKGKTYAINGLAFRDHGWGKRDFAQMVNCRWIAMSFGEQMNALMMIFQSANDRISHLGCVIRDGKLTYAKDIQIITYLESDGLSHRGGHVEAVLTTGERLTFECEALHKGVASWIHGICVVDMMCRVTCGDLVGICDFEIVNNALRGTHQPRIAINAIVENGLHAM